MRQFLVLLFTALLSPAVRALPARTADTAGKGAWLTGLLALPLFLLLACVIFSLFRDMPEGSGLAEVFQRALGRGAGKLLTTIYMVWALVLLCLEARLYGERMLSAGYRNASLAIFLLVLMALVLWMGRRKLSAFVRAMEIFFLALGLALGLVLLFSILDMTPQNLFPVWVEDLPGIAAATLVPLGALGGGVMALFLGGRIEKREGDMARAYRWMTAGCLALTALQFGVVGQLGPALSARLEAPFFEVAKGVGISGAFQRVESIVIALWVLSDFAMLGLLVFACRAMAGSILNGKGERWTAPVVAALGFLGGLFLFPDGFAAKTVDENVVPLGNLILGFGVPVLIWGAQRIKKRK